MADSSNYYVVILAGGGGTRLWPKSMKGYPKHLLKLFGERTMLQQTYDRIKSAIPDTRIIILTLHSYIPHIREQLPGFPKENIIAEPEAKNTALAMGFAAAVIQKKNPKAVVMNLAADHLIKDEKKFQDVVLCALRVAEETDNIVAIALKPTYAHIGLGYIKTGDEIKNLGDRAKNISVFQGKGFKEKPDLATAEAFLATNEYLWNGGMYCWSVDTFLQAAKKHHPDLYQSVEKISEAFGQGDEEKQIADVYKNAENIQIDYAISEKAANMLVIPGDFGWSDIGDWKVIYETKNKDNEGNVIDGEDGLFINIDCKNCLIEGNGRVIAAIGLENFVIIDTKEALLICNQDRTQDVKKVIEKLKEKKLDRYL